MQRILPWCFNIIYLVYAAILSVVFELHSLIILLPVFLLLRRGRFDDAMRFHNWYYGGFMVTMFWPLVRVRRRGLHHAPRNKPAIVVANHRSFFDMFFIGLIPRSNMITLVRSWPFGMPVYGWSMRLAGYLDTESLPFELVTKRVRTLADRGVSCLCYPEGHRSRDGRLQRFQSGAFRIAVDANLPILPVCIIGTEKLRATFSSLPRPTQVRIEMLPLVYPESFPGEKRALKLRRHVENMFMRMVSEE